MGKYIVYNFLDQSGVPFKPIEYIKPSNSDYAREIRENYPRYWAADPKVYISEGSLNPPQIKLDRL